MKLVFRFVENKVTGESDTPSEGLVELMFTAKGTCLMCGHTPGREMKKGECCICRDCLCCTRLRKGR